MVSNLSVTWSQDLVSALPGGNVTEPGGNPDLWTSLLTATISVQNTGGIAGRAVPQPYVSYQDADVPSGTPIQVLRGFDNLYLEPNETSKATFTLTRRDLSFWNVAGQDWQVPSGKAELRVGFSSRDIKTTGTVKLL